MQREHDGADFMFLNVGPQHPGTHGVLRIVLQLDGEEIVDAVPEIGFHHRGAEKMGERQTWHTYIPYTDRVDYLGGVMNNLAYLTAVEKLAGITGAAARAGDPGHAVRAVPHHQPPGLVRHLRAGPRTDVAGLLHCSPTASAPFGIIEAICGARMHPNWFRIGGVAAGPAQRLGPHVPRLPQLHAAAARGVRSHGHAEPHLQSAHRRASADARIDEAIDWGVTGPQPARLRLRVGLPQEAALRRLRAVRVRHPDRAARRLLRPRGGARGGDAAEPAHHRAVRGQHAGGSVQIGSSGWPRRRSRSTRCTISRR